MLKPSSPYGTRYGFTTRQQYLAFVNNQPRVLPTPRHRRPMRPLSSSQRVLCLLLTILAAPLLLLGFLLIGERPHLKS